MLRHTHPHKHTSTAKPLLNLFGTFNNINPKYFPIIQFRPPSRSELVILSCLPLNFDGSQFMLI